MGNYGWPSGANVAGMIISSAENGGAPSGDIIRLVGEMAGGQDNPGQKVTAVAGGTSYSTRDGKYTIKINFTNVIVIDGESAASNTAEFNNILTLIRDWHVAGHAPFYIWVYSFVDTDYVKIGYAGGAETDYLKGFVDQNGLNWEIKKGNVYFFKALSFVGCAN